MDQHHAAEEAEYGGYGTPTPEQELPGGEPPQADQRKEEAASASEEDSDGSAAVPSPDAELDDSNTEPSEPGKSFSSEPKGDATGLPEEKSPKDDDGETFDAG
ncbi:hypothetical protein [Arthrobacter sp. B2a2-09]|uniref:hypothetical protein n=1 Tax=Arthrobacter sp. B2a2-09 TaxID=2952822 RepID=UPI0022CD43D6|nr:hypothetical protein [Arthrobacter sp. B2a2-09]MCZ9884408.1 hypothetical protein [Arthrobacter sp. B2a2-09]